MPSNPLKSIRAKIFANLIRQLATIKVANGYAQDVINVTSDVKDWFQVSQAETPVLYLVDETTFYQYHAGRLTEREWDLSIYGVMKGSTQLDMEELIADVETALTANITLRFDGLPGPVSLIEIKNITTDRQLFSQIEGSQLFRVEIKVKYVARIDNVRDNS